MADAASDEAEPSDKVCKTWDAPASFETDGWKHFGFPASRNEKAEKVTERHRTIRRNCRTRTKTHRRTGAHTSFYHLVRALVSLSSIQTYDDDTLLTALFPSRYWSFIFQYDKNIL